MKFEIRKENLFLIKFNKTQRNLRLRGKTLIIITIIFFSIKSLQKKKFAPTKVSFLKKYDKKKPKLKDLLNRANIQTTTTQQKK